MIADGQEDAPPPPRPDFKAATELDAKTFDQKVEQIVNGSLKNGIPKYYPLVMFHVSWCQHCRHALPEFEQAAAMINEASQSGQLRNQLQAEPRFFVMECDTDPDAKPLCERHVRSSYPVLKLFRGKHSVTFNRPRLAQTIAWWSTHAARPAVTMATHQDHLDDYIQNGLTAFVLNTPFDATLEEDWNDIAFQYIEEYYFLIVRPNSDAARRLPPAPGVTVLGPGLDPLPFVGKMDRARLLQWVNFNRFAPLTEVSGHTGHDLMESQLPVVTLVYNNAMSRKRRKFASIAKELRKESRYLFAAANCSDRDLASYISDRFPLVHPEQDTSPLIFIFVGKDAYWEDPSFTNISRVTLPELDALMSSSEAHQDGSMASWGKGKRKMLVRLASSSVMGFSLVLGTPIAVVFCCWKCISSLLADDDEDEDYSKHVAKKKD